MAGLVEVTVPVSQTLRGRLYRALKLRGLNLQRWAAPLVGRRYGIVVHVTERRGPGRWELVAVHVWPPVEGLADLLAFAARNVAQGPKKAVQLDLFNNTNDNGTEESNT